MPPPARTSTRPPGSEVGDGLGVADGVGDAVDDGLGGGLELAVAPEVELAVGLGVAPAVGLVDEVGVDDGAGADALGRVVGDVLGAAVEVVGIGVGVDDPQAATRHVAAMTARSCRANTWIRVDPVAVFIELR